MSGTPLISVVMIFLNAQKFIEEAVDSVLAQTYDNWELLLVDDGSSDASSEMALEWASKNPKKVRYLEHFGHQNRGMSASRNLGINAAQGEYIAFLDSDDIWLPHKLLDQVGIMISQPEAGMLYGATRYWHSWTGNPEDINRDYFPDLCVPVDTLFKPPALLKLLYPLGRGAAPCPSDLFVRRDVVTRVGGFEESFQGICQLYEDQAFLAKIYLEAPVFVANQCWDQYRLHPDSCVSQVTKAGKQDLVEQFYLEWLEKYFLTQGIEDGGLWSALRRKQRHHRYPKLSHWVGRAQYRLEQMRHFVKTAAQRS